MISVGIDVSKGKSMVCILKPYGEVVCSPFEVMHTDAVFPDLMDRKKCDIMKWTQTNPKSQEELLCQSKKEQCHLVMTMHSRVARSRWLPNRGDLQRKLPPNSVYVLKLSNHGSSVPAFSPVQPIVKTRAFFHVIHFFRRKKEHRKRHKCFLHSF